MKNEYAQWRKLDNAALAFPAVTGKNDTRVFRFYCELKEEIKEENLFSSEELQFGWKNGGFFTIRVKPTCSFLL